MNDLHATLTALAEEIEFPPTPELLAAISRERPVSRRARRMRVAIVLVAIAAGIAAGLALSPGARSAFRALFRVGSVEIVRLDEAPPTAAARLVPFGRPVSLDEASRFVPFRIRLPRTATGRPPATVYLDRAGGGIVSLVWCCERRIVLTEVVSGVPGLLEKTVGPATLIEPVDVAGRRGLWVEGADHVVRVAAPDGPWLERTVRVRGGVLIWASDGVTLRLEGDVSKAEALAIARHVR
ncbi:hypothetical protein Gocc_2769 [Gaiella occulta]|uniref:DUF4367 domain-containing protein n=1 Tax=Gaiella occulta TaxID=1002870 RepID=A0A7M2YTJ7_9ACTN|nr:hypothetical protein [Gaiella occulta]RDI73413.1 hypothetical protein Gocc_2769 [Gaiella occulta]